MSGAGFRAEGCQTPFFVCSSSQDVTGSRASTPQSLNVDGPQRLLG